MDRKEHNKKLIQLLLEIRNMRTDEVTYFVNKFNNLYSELLTPQNADIEEKEVKRAGLEKEVRG
jgi:hypothetical protein